MGKLFIVGLGPGAAGQMTLDARAALAEADVLCGYTVYVDLVREDFPEKEILTTPMRREIERCRLALAAAEGGRSVAMLCSGDAGVYGMAGPILSLLAEYPNVEVCIVPGITAAISGAAVLGAPLMNDFCVISLSDLLTPWPVIEKRLRAAAEGDFAVCIYNPASHRRTDNLRKACEILMTEKSGDTPCGWVRQIGREGQEKRILTLRELAEETVDMFTTVFVGNSATERIGDYLVTARGYEV